MLGLIWIRTVGADYTFHFAITSSLLRRTLNVVATPRPRRPYAFQLHRGGQQVWFAAGTSLLYLTITHRAAGLGTIEPYLDRTTSSLQSSPRVTLSQLWFY